VCVNVCRCVCIFSCECERVYVNIRMGVTLVLRMVVVMKHGSTTAQIASLYVPFSLSANTHTHTQTHTHTPTFHKVDLIVIDRSLNLGIAGHGHAPHKLPVLVCRGGFTNVDGVLGDACLCVCVCVCVCVRISVEVVEEGKRGAR
jgi:hypothetical protein